MYRYLSIDLTSHCNLRCWFCGKQYGDMQRSHLTLHQLNRVMGYVVPYITGDMVRISGGEPLTNPLFNDMMHVLHIHFPRIEVATNGLLLDTIDPLITPFTTFLLSHYPNINDDIIQRTAGSRYVKLIEPSIIDPTRDLNLSDSQSQYAYSHCVYHMAKVVGDRVYDCCHGETMERVHGTPMGVQIGPGWVEELEQVEKWRGCSHCFIARGE